MAGSSDSVLAPSEGDKTEHQVVYISNAHFFGVSGHSLLTNCQSLDLPDLRIADRNLVVSPGGKLY